MDPADLPPSIAQNRSAVARSLTRMPRCRLNNACSVGRLPFATILNTVAVVVATVHNEQSTLAEYQLVPSVCLTCARSTCAHASSTAGLTASLTRALRR